VKIEAVGAFEDQVFDAFRRQFVEHGVGLGGLHPDLRPEQGRALLQRTADHATLARALPVDQGGPKADMRHKGRAIARQGHRKPDGPIGQLLVHQTGPGLHQQIDGRPRFRAINIAGQVDDDQARIARGEVFGAPDPGQPRVVLAADHTDVGRRQQRPGLGRRRGRLAFAPEGVGGIDGVEQVTAFGNDMGHRGTQVDEKLGRQRGRHAEGGVDHL
jgi:hypothetical protein